MGIFNVYPYLNVNDLNLDWIIKHFKEFIEAISALEAWKSEHENEYRELKALYDNIVSGNFPPAMYSALHDWVVHNAASIIGEIIKMVFFEITDTGYFAAYIPDSWSEIIFGTTGLDDFPAGVDFGHLTLSY